MNQLHQVLIIKPQCSFTEIARIMKSMGWQYDALDFGSAPLIDGEIEVASWSWGGYKPFITYTFNPVVRMRVLDVAGVPPRLREALGNQLPLMEPKGIENLFESEDARARLLGLWISQELEAVEFMDKAQTLIHDKEEIVAEEAAKVYERLGRINQARTEVMVQMRIMEEAVPALIRQMNDRQFVQSLKPQRADLERLFDEELVDVAARAIDQIYADSNLGISVNGAQIKVVGCPAGLLRWPNMLSNKFPGGYRDLAGWMAPNRIWFCWKLEATGATVAYDGLVWIDDHWCWLPKIFRDLGPYLLSGHLSSGMGGATRH